MHLYFFWVNLPLSLENLIDVISSYLEFFLHMWLIFSCFSLCVLYLYFLIFTKDNPAAFSVLHLL